jgi:hypothetical protein
VSEAPAGALLYAAHRAASTLRRAAVHDALAKGLSAPLTAVLGTVLDIAWAKPTAAQIRAAGAVGVIGYLSNDTSKNLSASQVGSYVLAGVRVGTVWETTAGRALAGYAAGQADARSAEQQRKAVGLPATSLHRFAVDTDTTWNAVAPYFEGCASVLGKGRTAAYGGYKITTGAYGYGLRRNWQTIAWSGGRLDPNAALYQNGRTALGGDADINAILAADWGQYPSIGGDVSTPIADGDIDRIVAAVWGHTETNKASGQPVRMGTVLAWLDFERQQLSGVLTDAITQAVTDLSAKIGALAALELTDTQVQAISAQLGPAVADVLAQRLAGLAG